MEPNERELSPQESLHLIQSMINKTKTEVADDSFYFLMWGWLVFTCCIVEYVMLSYMHSPYHYAVWWTMPIGGVVSAIYGARQSKKQQVKTFVEDAINYVWIAIGFSFICIVAACIMQQNWGNAFTYYILLYAIGTFVTGRLLQFKPLVIGGLINFALAIVSAKFNQENQLLVGAVAIGISYIIPGHLLRVKYQQQKQLS